MKSIINLFLGAVIGTAFVYDMYFGIIPNKVIIIGYFVLFPYTYLSESWNGVYRSVVAVVLSGTILLMIFLVHGISAGDVKLLSMLVGYFKINDGLKFLVLVFYIGAFVGIIKIIMNVAVNLKIEKGMTKIKFSAPILAGYMLMLISKGG